MVNYITILPQWSDTEVGTLRHGVNGGGAIVLRLHGVRLSR